MGCLRGFDVGNWLSGIGWEPTLRNGSFEASQGVAAHGNDLLLRQCSSPASGCTSLWLLVELRALYRILLEKLVYAGGK